MTTDKQALSVPSRVKGLLVLIFISQTTSFVFGLIALLVADIPGMTQTQASIILSATMLVMSFVGPYVGRGLDLGKGILWSILAIVFYAIGILGFVFNLELHSFAVVPILLFYFLSLVIAQILCSALIEGYIDPSLRQKTATLMSMSGNFAVVFANLGAYFFFKENRSLLLVIDLATNILMFGYMAYCFKNLHIPKRHSESFTEQLGPWKSMGKCFASYPALMLSCILLFAAVYAQAYIFPMLFKLNGVDSYKFTTLMGTINGLLVVLVGFLITKNLSFKTFHSKLVATCFFTGVGFLFMPYAHDLPTLIIPVVIWSLGEITIFPVTTQIVYSVFPEDQIGIAAATKGILARLSQVVTPLIAIAMLNMPLVFQALCLSIPFIGAYFVFRQFMKKRPEIKWD